MELSKRALNGLSGSIRKWEKIYSGEGIDSGEDNCPLCQLYGNNDCKSCPIFRATKIDCCDDSPFTEWVDHHINTHDTVIDLKIECPKCKELAQEELDFLKSLLP